MVSPEHHVALVDHLIESTEPVRRMWPVRARMALFVVGWSVAVAAIVRLAPRPDLGAKLDDPWFVLGIVVLAAASAFTTLMALRCAVPGRTPTRTEGLVALVAIAGAAVVAGLVTAPEPAAEEGWHCALRTLLIATIPWGILLIAIRRGAPVRVVTAAVYAATAAVLCTTTLLRFACPADGSGHWLVWHLGVVPLGVLLATPFATRWLQGWRHD